MEEIFFSAVYLSRLKHEMLLTLQIIHSQPDFNSVTQVSHPEMKGSGCRDIM
jgi:hypothetical protein